MRLIDLDLALPDAWQDYRERRARERREAAEREQALLRADEDDEDDEDDEETSLPYQAPRPERRSLGIGRDGCARPSR